MVIQELFKSLMNEGLRTFKFKNSKLKPAGWTEKMKGSIFAYRSKKQMIKSNGIIITSVEALVENQDKFTHFTPNVYRFGQYIDKKRKIVKGHSEENLRQINAFFIDFDIKKEIDSNMSAGDILLMSFDLGFIPTFILKSERGYQAFYLLSDPVYVSRLTNFKSVKAAKKISENLRHYFSKKLPVDLTCNHFGIARIPRTDNIEYLDLENQYSFEEFQEWSFKYSDRIPEKKPDLYVLTGDKGKRQIDEPWFNLLLNTSKFRGKKGLLGRNNVIFTLALAYYSSGISQATAKYNLQQFNEYLDYPLDNKEFLKIITSAYSGKYKAAKKEYVLALCQEWCDEKLTDKDLFTTQVWYKLKKDRSQRQRVHMHEWKADLIEYLNKVMIDKPYIVTTKKMIREALNISERSLDRLLVQMERDGEIILKAKSGRNGGIKLTLITTVIEYLKIYLANKKSMLPFWRQLKEGYSLSELSMATLKKAIQIKLVKEYPTIKTDTG